MNMDFSGNETPVEIVKEGAFGGTYFRNIYSGVNGKWYTKSLRKLKNIDQNYCSNHYDLNVKKYKDKCGASLRLRKNNGGINSVDLYGWFQWYLRYWLRRRSLDDKRQIARI